MDSVPARGTKAVPNKLFTRFRLSLFIRLFILLLVGGLIVVVAFEWDFWVGSSALQTTNDAYLQADTTPLAAKVPGATAIPDNYYNWLG
jgi:membrane fusion protein, multidrug efflux system